MYRWENLKLMLGGRLWSNYLLEFNSYLTENTIHVHCREQSVCTVNVRPNTQTRKCGTMRFI